MKLNALSAAIAATLISSSAMAVEFHGYARAGIGLNMDSSTQECYGDGTNGHAVGRLGDECDMYAELALSQDVVQSDAFTFSIHTLVAYAAGNPGNSYQTVSPQNDADGNSNGPWAGQETTLRELYAKGDFGNYTLWAGNRYYGRKDIHIGDFYYVNGSGYGAGVENISVGSLGQVSVAWRQPSWKSSKTVSSNADDRDVDANGNQVEGLEPGTGMTGTGPATGTTDLSAQTSANIIDLRWAGIPMWKNASLEVIAMYGMTNYTKAEEDEISAIKADGQDWAPVNGTNAWGEKHAGKDWALDEDGINLTAEWTQGALLGGFNKAVVQYGTEGFSWNTYMGFHLGDAYNMEADKKDRASMRFIDWGVISPTKDIDLGYSFIFATMDNGAKDAGFFDENNFYSIILRPVYKWTDSMKTIVELGYSANQAPAGWTGGEDLGYQDLSKITLAQEWAAARGFWGRPSLRVFVTQYGGDQKVDDKETMFGAQMEAWW